MKFSRLTYWVALRRQLKREYQAFSDHHGALRGSHEWIKEIRLGRLLRARKKREGGEW